MFFFWFVFAQHQGTPETCFLLMAWEELGARGTVNLWEVRDRGRWVRQQPGCV